MTLIADAPPREPFRLGQLLYDTRYRSLTIQVVALLGIVGLLVFLVGNLVQNLHQLGKDIDFGFLRNRAGYDINQTLIPYDNSMSHGRAALVGMLNTLLVAVTGCAAATVIGVLAGVLRLSRNWLVSRLMAVYVEGFRNIPLVLWIVLVYAILTESTPQPRDFAGEDPLASMILGSIAVTNRGTYIPAPVWGAGAWVLLVVLALSVAGIWAWRRYARLRQMATGQRLPVAWISLALLAVPVALAYLLLGQPLTFSVPTAGKFNFQGGITVLNSFVALWLALSLYTGAFIAENVRAGILAVSRGQTEAASALGLRAGRVMSLVVLPQALRVIIPPLISQYLNLTKNSSLAVAVGYMDIKATLGGITLNQTGRELESILLLGGIYLAISIAISTGMNAYNRRVAIRER